nr:MAG TPA: hypothetical protein [Caudoviricetes sp.]
MPQSNLLWGINIASSSSIFVLHFVLHSFPISYNSSNL